MKVLLPDKQGEARSALLPVADHRVRLKYLYSLCLYIRVTHASLLL